MSKKDLIDAVASSCDLTKEKAGIAVDAVLAHIKAAMKEAIEDFKATRWETSTATAA